MLRGLLVILAFFLLLDVRTVGASSHEPVKAKKPECLAGAICFSGEISAGKEFRKAINEHMEFVLIPQSNSGWDIEIVPGPQESGCDKSMGFGFASVVTAPYRYHSALNINMSYGISAEDEVSSSPRDFNFVMNCKDEKTEADRLSIILWPYNFSDREVDRAQNELGSSPQGTALLWITDSKVSHASDTADEKSGTIEWMRFVVEIKLPKTTSPKPHSSKH